MADGYVLLIEKEEMWAKMLMQVLEDNHVPCAAIPVFGAGFSIKTGKMERLSVYVPEEHLQQAKELVRLLFSAEIIQEDE